MKVLVIGGGGREHALVWSLRKSPRVTDVICAPGNGGIAAIARCLPLDVASIPDTLALVLAEQPGLVVIGPEVPLAAGLTDALEARGVRVFGPTRAAARLESSKAFAKLFMQRHAIPTARYAICETLPQVEQALSGFAAQLVVKADGLAAGKGVVLCETHGDALFAAAEMFNGQLLGAPAGSLVLEERLTGPEVSFFALCDGERAIALATAQDHKRVGEGDTGPNTGGMGAYSTDTLVPPALFADMLAIAQTVVDGMRTEGTPFVGVLFIGFMLTPSGPRVLEFNTRFGDPETEAILLRLESSLLDLLEAVVDRRLDQVLVSLKPGASACVIVASEGYPGPYPSGRAISGTTNPPAGVEIFHAGTTLQGGRLVTAGGRVLAVTATGDTLQEALGAVYATLHTIHFDGMHYRRDIGWQAI